jgi:hypothetical protein
MRYAHLFLTPVCIVALAAPMAGQTHSLLERSPMFDVLDMKTRKTLAEQLRKLVPSLNNWRSLPSSEEERLLDKMLPNRREIEHLTSNNAELRKQLREELDEQLERIFWGTIASMDREEIVDKFIRGW